MWDAFCAIWPRFTSAEWLAGNGLHAGVISYDDATKKWLAESGHYLEAPPPGALLAIGVSRMVTGLFGPTPGPDRCGLALVGRPIARMLPQDGSVGELVRFVLVSGLPKHTASHVLRVTSSVFFGRGRGAKIIRYHDRARHTGCIYKKAGWKHDRGPDGTSVTRPGTRRGTWSSRAGREQAASSEATSKRRWSITKAA